MMDRRRFLLTSLVGAFAKPRAVEAQPTGKVRIGYMPAIPEPNANTEVFRDSLRDLGHIDGQNIVIEWRWGYRFREDAEELVRLKVAVILASGSPCVSAAAKATQAIPIVAVDLESDPVASGFAMSLARPGGNLTGIFLDLPGLSAKLVDLMRPLGAERFAVLWDAAMDPTPLRAIEVAARDMGVSLRVLPVRGQDDIDNALAVATTVRTQVLIVLPSPMMFFHRSQIATRALSRRIPMIAPMGEFVAAGGVMSYGPNIKEIFRRAPVFVDKILKGAKPSDLPVERPTRFEMMINLKTAKALGLTIPPSLLARADQVIE